MQVNCTVCRGKAIIHSRKQLDIKMSQLYCACKDPNCGHTFVMDLTFSHSLSPSGRDAKQMALELFRALPDEERQQWLAAVG